MYEYLLSNNNLRFSYFQIHLISKTLNIHTCKIAMSLNLFIFIYFFLNSLKLFKYSYRRQCF